MAGPLRPARTDEDVAIASGDQHWFKWDGPILGPTGIARQVEFFGFCRSEGVVGRGHHWLRGQDHRSGAGG
jgi:hypothetical protein